MRKPEIIQAILKLVPATNKTRLGKLKKAVLEARLADLQAASAPAGLVGGQGATAGGVPQGMIGGQGATTVHVWKQMCEGPDVAESWSSPDSARWCGVCGMRVRNVAAIAEAPVCEGKPADRALTVKAIKSFRGMEGYGFNCTLYRDGKKLGLVIDEGCGGSMLFRCFDSHEEQAEYERWARLQEGTYAFDPLDLIVSTLVGEYEERAKLKRWCRKQTVVKLKDDPKDSYSIWKVPYTPAFAAKLRAKNDVVEIINERFLVKA